jgi:hypothetical protein
MRGPDLGPPWATAPPYPPRSSWHLQLQVIVAADIVAAGHAECCSTRHRAGGVVEPDSTSSRLTRAHQAMQVQHSRQTIWRLLEVRRVKLQLLLNRVSPGSTSHP